MENLYTSNPPTLLKAMDVAKRLNISRTLAYQLMQTGEIPTIKIRKLVRVSQADLEQYISTSRSVSDTRE
jgi:excisionase family DNA binding protein